jgi:hypothetical protein
MMALVQTEHVGSPSFSVMDTSDGACVRPRVSEIWIMILATGLFLPFNPKIFAL